MKPKLKPLAEQVIVITGATSGIGLSTARAAAARGASLVLAARNEAALKSVCQDLGGRGAKVAYVVADVGVRADVARIARTAVERFGGFDTWINNAGAGLYGRLTDVSVEDQRRLFETDYWGVVYGSLTAVEHLRERPGGAVINIGALLGDVTVPLQGAVSAAKHAVHAFTSTLRMELKRDRVPVSVTLIRPGAVDTPYADNARSYLDRPRPDPGAIHAAPLVAQAILYAAEHPARQVTIGGLTGAAAYAAGLLPPLSERLITWFGRWTKTRSGALVKAGNLHQPGRDLRERAWRKNVREQSVVVAAQMRPRATAGLAATLAAAAVACFVVGRRLRVRSSQARRRT